MNKEELSKYFSEMSKKRKSYVGGFKSPEVQQKIQEAKRKKKAKLGSEAQG